MRLERGKPCRYTWVRGMDASLLRNSAGGGRRWSAGRWSLVAGRWWSVAG